MLDDEPTGNLDSSNTSDVTPAAAPGAPGGQAILMVKNDARVAKPGRPVINLFDGMVTNRRQDRAGQRTMKALPTFRS